MVYNFDYTGNVQEITLTKGFYRLECWGAQGGYRSNSSYGGKGGYSCGVLSLDSDTKLYIYVGGSGNTGGTSGGFNGGGKRGSYVGGGGATDMRIGEDSLYARVIVAGGGGSDGATNKNGMYGGGTTGGSSTQGYGSGGYGGTQTGVSSSSWQTTTQSSSTTTQAGAYAGFGFGGNGITYAGGYGGAGGGGWYGGSGAYPDGSGDDDRGGGGGSGYVYTASTASSYPSGCKLNSSYYLLSARTIAGNVSHPSTDGRTETGHIGNGYARITCIGEEYNPLNNYELLEYIQTDGRLYIDTGIIPTSNTKIEIDFTYLGSYYQLGWTVLYGSRGSSTSTYFCFLINNDGEPSVLTSYVTPNYAGFDPGNGSGKTISSGERYKIKTDMGNLYMNDTLILSLSTSNTLTSSTVSLCLFALKNTSGIENRNIKVKCYSFKIYDGDNLIMDCIPARNNENMVGFYNKVDDIFYTSQGSTNFIAGPKILPPINPYKFRRRLLSKIVNNDELIWIPLGSNYSTNRVYYRHLLHFDVRTPIYAIARTDLKAHDCLWCSWLTFMQYPPIDNNDYVTLSECNGYTTGKNFGSEYKTETKVYAKDYNYPVFAIRNYDSIYTIVLYWDYSTNKEVNGPYKSLSTIFNPEYIPELDKTIYTYYFDSPKYFSYCQSGIDITRYYILVPKNYVQTTINKWV